MIRRTFFLAGLAAVYCLGSLAFAQEVYIGGEVKANAQALNVPVYRVAVEADSEDLAALAKRVLSTHGSYSMSPAANAQIVFSFSKTSESGVRLTLRGAKGFERAFSAEDWKTALMKACDAATYSILGTPGYFSGRLAFTYSKGSAPSQIYTSDIGFQSVRALTTDNADSIMPHFSPDGTRVAYTGYFRSGFMDLYEINLASKTRRVLASYKGSNTGGAYSPDGSKMAFILSSTGNAEVWVGTSSGKNMKRLTKTSATESSASFSPDGSKIVFASDPNGSPRIYTMPVAGGRPTAVPTHISNYCSEPAWNFVNPDKIAFTAAVSRVYQIAVFDYKTRKSTFVTSGLSTSWPTWLNDGRHIVCTKTQGKEKSLWIVDTETGKQTRLHTAQFGNASEPTFHHPGL